MRTTLIPIIGLALLLSAGCQKSRSDAAEDLASVGALINDFEADVVERRPGRRIGRDKAGAPVMLMGCVQIPRLARADTIWPFTSMAPSAMRGAMVGVDGAIIRS